MDGARIYAENSIRKRNKQMNTISKSMGSIVNSLESSLTTGNFQKMSETMDQFEKQFVNMEVQAEFMESSMAGSTSLSTPEGDVNSLMQQVAYDYGLEVSVGLPQAGHAIMVASKSNEKVDEDDLSRRLAELNARGGNLIDLYNYVNLLFFCCVGKCSSNVVHDIILEVAGVLVSSGCIWSLRGRCHDLEYDTNHDITTSEPLHS
ncbi:hypothetical protein IFM89_019258 [Coptis chinensis]|uniref:Uncharacterized protein n=1 Tax=Coptis chinensis TaxID=261450 RepID=A0A835H6F9_9MAGN|nr:hypothetical protein IFM89_019258 [Coptis chinensis]